MKANSIEQLRNSFLQTPTYEWLFIVLPPLVLSLFFVLAPRDIESIGYMNAILLFCFVVIDGGHVFSTIFITYFDRSRNSYQKLKYVLVFLITYFGIYFFLSLTNQNGLWSLLAYLAIFHFIRQQFGLMKLYYSNSEPKKKIEIWLDDLAIYSTTIYPYIYWHAHLPREAGSVFRRSSFIQFPAIQQVSLICGVLTVLLIVSFVIKEIYFFIIKGRVELQKFAVVIGSAVAWWVSIVYFYDWILPYSVIQTVSHGVPYWALLWIYGRTANQEIETRSWFFISKWGLVTMVVIASSLSFLLIFGWEHLIYASDYRGYHPFSNLPNLVVSPISKYLEAFFASCQVTHYGLDSLIWKRNLGDVAYRSFYFRNRRDA